MGMDRPRTLGELRASGYRMESVKDEMRRNLIRKLRAGEPLFPDILGYEETVVPQIQNAILSRHDMLFLGLRGQAKTRMLRQLVHLLDDAMPVVAGSEINDHPYHPISKYARELVAEQGDDTPIDWIRREQRYHEKLATPDVTIADLIGEIDMIKHAEGRYLSSELTMHFGLIPRTNRGIFCINELPDLAPKIQVGLFNVLEERDVQIRGYPIRLDLDVCMVFSANPEDYTNRGRIVTPLKDRIGSVVRTHYPAHARDRHRDQRAERLARPRQRRRRRELAIPVYMKEIVEEISRLARSSPHVNQQSGVSVRMSIANLENVVSNAERRALSDGRDVDRAAGLRPGFAAASSRGKLELTMTEEEGHEDKLIHRIIDEAVKNIFGHHFDVREFRPIVDYFESGQSVEIGDMLPAKAVLDRIAKVPGLRKRAEEIGTRPPARPQGQRRPRRGHRQRRRVHPRGAARPQQAEQVGQGGRRRTTLIEDAQSGGRRWDRHHVDV